MEESIMRTSMNLLVATALSGVATTVAAQPLAERPAPVVSDVFEAALPAAFGSNIGTIDDHAQLTLVLTLPLVDPNGGERFVRAVSTPGTAGYGRFVSPAQFAERFGASAGDYAAVVAWAQANGLRTGRASVARTSVSVTGDAAVLERLFTTRVARFATPAGKPGFAPLTAPTLPHALVGKVSGVLGFVDTGRKPTLYRPMRPEIAHPDSGSGVLGAFSPSDLRSIYVVPPLLAPGATQSVALFEQGGFVASDIDVFKQKYKLPDVPVVVKGVNGSPTGDTPEVDVECDLDIDMAIGVNPHLKQVTVYEDAIDPFPVALVDSLAQIADDNSAQTVSVSYGFDEAMAAKSDELAVRTVALQMAAQGQTVFVATGDDGAYGNEPPNLNTSFPSTDPFVTAVGGTTLFSYQGAYAGEEVWNLLGLGAGATGGGISTVFAIPDWQKPGGMSVAAANGGSSTMRNVPDVAAVGDPQTGVSVYVSTAGGWNIIGGTSASSPIWAGFNSVMNGARIGAGQRPFGFLNPLLYKLGESDAFGTRDVSDGSNGNATIYGSPGYNAGYGYDDASGWGSINVGRYVYSALIEAHASGTKPAAAHDVSVTPSTSGISVNWTAGAGATGYLLTIGPADSGTPVPNPLVNKVTTGTHLTVGGLASGTAYYLYVIALNNAGSTSTHAIFFSTASQSPGELLGAIPSAGDFESVGR